MYSFRGKEGVITGTKEKRLMEQFSSYPYMQLNTMLWAFTPQWCKWKSFMMNDI